MTNKKVAAISAGIVVAGLAALGLILAAAPETMHRKIAAGCFIVCSLGFFITACVYFFTPKFMPYHRDAVSLEWEAIPPLYQTMIIAVLRIVAGGFFCASLGAALLLWTAFRQGLPWAGPVIFCVINAMALPAIYGTSLVQRHSPANPPLAPLVLVFTLSAMGLALA